MAENLESGVASSIGGFIVQRSCRRRTEGMLAGKSLQSEHQIGDSAFDSICCVWGWKLVLGFSNLVSFLMDTYCPLF